MAITIALAGNPNSGKTTLFNAITGANQFVGNWPGVTVEKKEGRLKSDRDVRIEDLPGIYSLSPYTLEEVVARNYLVNEKPSVIIDIVDGTNIERNLYLTTQLLELSIPVVVAVNMSDIVEKSGDEIDTNVLSEKLGCPVISVSALKGDGVQKLIETALSLADSPEVVMKYPTYSRPVEDAIESVSARIEDSVPENMTRYYDIKLLDNDEQMIELIPNPPDVSEEREKLEKKMDDDVESIITNERYDYIADVISDCVDKKPVKDNLTISDKIDKIVTNRFLAIPIFAVVIFLIYFISVTTVGTVATDWANDGVFGDGWFLAGIGRGDFDDADEEYGDAYTVVSAFVDDLGDEELADAIDDEAEDYDPDAAMAAVLAFADTIPEDAEVVVTFEDEETLATEEELDSREDFMEALGIMEAYGFEAPDPADYGPWIPGIPVLLDGALSAVGVTSGPLYGVIMDGIVAGVGAVLGFVPQIFILFFFLAILEECGYMARVAFIMDRIFRKFGLSGKSFIPMLISSGCGVPGIMASRTIENDRDRKMTIMTTTFIPCGAKLPFIALVAGAIFHGAPWVAPSAYFLGIAAVIVSGIMLKKTKIFAGDPAPFVMELPAYHIPTVGSVLRSMWERGWSFIKKAGTIILLSTIVIWFLTYFGFVDGVFTMLEEDEIDQSLLAMIGSAISFIFIPLGFGNWQATVASITGLIAKENIVGTLGIIYHGAMGTTVYANIAAAFTAVSGYAFLAFNLLCAPCFAAMGAIRREMNSMRWFFIAIGYQCGFAYLVGQCINQIGNLITTGTFTVFTVIAFICVALCIFMLVRPEQKDINYKASMRSVEAVKK